MPESIGLAEAKARLSEVVRRVRATRLPVVITLDGEPAVQVVPVEEGARRLTPAETATHRVLAEAVLRIPQPEVPFDAVALVGEGRR